MKATWTLAVLGVSLAACRTPLPQPLISAVPQAFEPSNHRRTDGRLVSTRLDFDYHHSWIGRFASCSFHSQLLVVVDLSPIGCTGVGVTEAIERLSFTEQVTVWR